MGIAFTICMISMLVLLIYTANAYDNSLYVPSEPPTTLEIKAMDIRHRISQEQSKFIVEKVDDGTRIYAGGGSRNW